MSSATCRWPTGTATRRGSCPPGERSYSTTSSRGSAGLDVEDVYLGNGVSELIVMAMQALLNNGDQVLIPAPDYPLWTAAVSLSGGTPVHYLCDEGNGWMPDLADIEAKITPATKAIVIINPNNPTGAVYSRELLEGVAELARREGLLILADEIYDRILFDDAEHVSIAPLAPDLPSLTFSGLSKAYRVCGFRSGWMVVSGPKEHAESYIEGLNMLANMRLCPNVPGQHAIQAALGGYQSINDLVLPGGRLREQRDRACRLLNEIPGVSCVKPWRPVRLPPARPGRLPDRGRRALRPRPAGEPADPRRPGNRVQLAHPDHLRVVTLQHADDLEEAIGRLGEFLQTRRA